MNDEAHVGPVLIRENDDDDVRLFSRDRQTFYFGQFNHQIPPALIRCSQSITIRHVSNSCPR